MRFHPIAVSFLVLAGAVGPLFGAEQTFILRNYDTVRGERYMGAVDFSAYRAESGPPDCQWIGYGAAPLYNFMGHGQLCIETEFDLGRVPRGTVTRATLRYTLSFRHDIGPAEVALRQVAHFPDQRGPLVGRQALPAEKAGAEVAVEFDVTDSLRAAGSHVAFELAAPYDRYICYAYCGGRQGPVARDAARLPLTPQQRPTLAVSVEAPADLPPILATACVGVGQSCRFGAAAGMTYRLVEKPSASALADADVSAGAITPDAEGRFVVEGLASGVKQYATLEARRVVLNHPRLWLTPQTLDKFRDMRAIGHPLWIDLMRRTDDLTQPAANRGKPGGFDDLQAIELLSLRYVVTGDKDFAQPCKAIMDRLAAASLPMVSADAGYVIRSAGRAMALGFDRIYPELTADEKWKYVDEMDYWLAWYAAEGYQSAGPPCGNYFSGYFAALNMAAYATFQDNPRGAILVDRMRALFDRFIAQEAEHGVLRGGDDPEGRYSDLYFDTWFRYLLARRTAGGEGPIPGFDWPQEVACSQIHRLRPDRRTVYDGGAWNDTAPSRPSSSTMSLLSSLLAGSKEGGYAQRFADQQYDLKGTKLSLNDYVTYDPDRPEAKWDREPLSYFSRGLGLATMRSSWDDDAVWASFQNAGPHFADHQHWDAGHWEIYRGADPLVVDPIPDDEGASTVFHNCLIIDSGGKVNPYSPRQAAGGGLSQAYEDTGAYVYLAGDFAAHYTFQGRSVVKTLERQFLYVRPNLFILFDRFEPADQKYKAVNRIHFAAAPTIDGATVVALRGASKVWVRAFGDSPATLAQPGGRYQENAVDISLPPREGPRLMIVVIAAQSVSDAAPEVACQIQGPEIKLHLPAPAADITLHCDGTPGGAITLDGKTHPLAETILAPAP